MEFLLDHLATLLLVTRATLSNLHKACHIPSIHKNRPFKDSQVSRYSLSDGKNSMNGISKFLLHKWMLALHVWCVHIECIKQTKTESN